MEDGCVDDDAKWDRSLLPPPSLTRLHQQSLSLFPCIEPPDSLGTLPMSLPSPRSQPLPGHCELVPRRSTLNPESQLRTVSSRGTGTRP